MASSAWWRRNTIGTGMVAVAGLALILAWGSLLGTMAVLIVWPAVLVALSGPLARRWGCSRLRAYVWLAVAYPWLGLGLAAVLPWGLIRTTASWVGSAVEIVGASLIWGSLLILLTGPLVLLAELLLTVERREPDQGRETAWLVLLPFVSWISAFPIAVAIVARRDF